ncbi:unnamed protein product [Closterium sp. Naga37s-1]|nr:unnamed protein product [Closterium sp. Naga37s-1]
MASSWHLTVLAVCTLALLLAPAAARPTKGDFIAEVKKARDALNDPKLNGRHRASVTFLDNIIPQMETDWNPTDDFLDKADRKTVLIPEDVAIASAVPDALYSMIKPSVKPSEVRSYKSLIRANILDGLYEESDIKSAKDLKDVNGRKVDKSRVKIKGGKLFRGKFFILQEVDSVQPLPV